MPLLERKSQHLFKEEAVSGTAETLTNSDGGWLLLAGVTFEPNIEKEPRNVMRSSLTPLADLVGKKAGSMTIQTEVNAPDTITDALPYLDMLRCAGVNVGQIDRIPIGAIGTGPFQRGEAITGSIAGAGRVLFDQADGATHLYYETTGGNAFASGEVITGGASSASATSSGNPESAGHRGYPYDATDVTGTSRLELDGYKWELLGCASNLVFVGENARRGIFEFGLEGKKGVWGDGALTSNISFIQQKPRTLNNAQFTIDGTFVPVATSLGFDLQNVVNMRENVNDIGGTGYIASQITGRDPIVTTSVEMSLASQYDYFQRYDQGDSVSLSFKIGNTEGRTFQAHFDQAQIRAISKGENNGNATLDLTFNAHGLANGQNDEFEFLWY